MLALIAIGCGEPAPDPDAPKSETPRYFYKGTWKEETPNSPTTYEFEGSRWTARKTMEEKDYKISGTFFGSDKSLTFTRTDDLTGQVSDKNFQVRNFTVQVEWIDGKHFNILDTNGTHKFAKQN